jgi:hypothetical protein
MSLDELQFPDWQIPYIEALIETNEIRYTFKMGAALQTIAQRLTRPMNALSAEEREALEDALLNLRVLQHLEDQDSQYDVA